MSSTRPLLLALALALSLAPVACDSPAKSEPAQLPSSTTGVGGAGGQGGGAGGLLPTEQCPTFDSGTERGRTQGSPINELSGIAASRINADLLWVHNDSGGDPRIFAIHDSAQFIGTYNLVGAYADDWEDIAVGPGPNAAENYIYVGDIGDNFEDRPFITVYRVLEPVVMPQSTPATIDLTGVDALELAYPDSAHNAEALMVDPIDGAIYIVTKADDGASLVFRAAAPHAAGQRAALELVANLQFGVAPLVGDPKVTASDISPDGSMIVLRTYDDMYLWPRQPGQSIAEALAGAACALPIREEVQGEAVGFAADGSGYFTASENRGADPNRPEPLWFFAQM